MPPEDNNEKNMSAENQPNWNDENMWNNIPEYHEENSSNQTPEPKNEAQMGDAGLNEPKFADNNLHQIETSASTNWVDSQPILYPTDPVPMDAKTDGDGKDKAAVKENRRWASSLSDELEAIKGNSMGALIAKFANLRHLPPSYSIDSSNPTGELSAALELRLAQLEDKASREGLLIDVRQKESEILEPAFKELQSDATKGKLRSNDPRINFFKNTTVNGQRLDSIGLEEGDELKGIRQFMLDRLKDEYRHKLDNLKENVSLEENSKGIIIDMKEYLSGIDRLEVEDQKEKVRRALRVIEKTNGSIVTTDAYKELSKFVELDPERKLKGELHPDVEREIIASIHLCETVLEVRDGFNFESDNVKNDMERTVKRLKASHLLATTRDFEMLNIEGYSGHYIAEATDLLRKAAKEGLVVPGHASKIKYQGKIDPEIQDLLNTELISIIQKDHKTTPEIAERSVNLALKARRAKMEDLADDESISHPVSEAIRFGEHLASKNKVFATQEGIDIVTLGTSFDRQLSHISKPYSAVFQVDLDEILRTNPDPEKASAAWWLKAQSAPVDYSKGSYVLDVDRDAYEKYLTGYLPAMLESKKIFMDASKGATKRSEVAGLAGNKMLETVRKVDPYGVQNLQGRLLRWWIRLGHRDAALDWDFDQTSTLLYILVNNQIITKETRNWVEKYAQVRSGGLTVTALEKLQGLKNIIGS